MAVVAVDSTFAFVLKIVVTPTSPVVVVVVAVQRIVPATNTLQLACSLNLVHFVVRTSVDSLNNIVSVTLWAITGTAPKQSTNSTETTCRKRRIQGMDLTLRNRVVVVEMVEEKM